MKKRFLYQLAGYGFQNPSHARTKIGDSNRIA